MLYLCVYFFSVEYTKDSFIVLERMEYIRHDELLGGVYRGAWFGQNERTDELNERIYSRNIADVPLTPNFDPRPVATKQSMFPMINLRVQGTDPVYPHVLNVSGPSSSSRNMPFVPGNRVRVNADGYFANIDVESELRTQTTALQHGAYQGVYIPSSKSDLYTAGKVDSPSHGRNSANTEQPFPHLFRPVNGPFYTHIQDDLSTIGRNVFFNHTRTQLRNM